jgi:hypothetical protein
MREWRTMPRTSSRQPSQGSLNHSPDTRALSASRKASGFGLLSRSTGSR